MRTVMVAVATEVSDDWTIETSGLLDNDRVISVFDRDQPENNLEPQIFAAYAEEEVKEEA